MGPDRALHLLKGEESISSLTEAQDLFQALKGALEGEIDPTAWAEQAIEAILQVIKAMETEERGCQLRGWCYGALYGALDMGSPPEPPFSGSLGGPDQDTLDKQGWQGGVAAAQEGLGGGQAGTALRNKILLRVAQDSGQPVVTLNAMWRAACEKTQDSELISAYPNLSWPEPVGA